MSSYDAEVMARQLAQLGRDLQDEVMHLGELEEESVNAEGRFRVKEYALDDAIDKAFLSSDGSVETRKAVARTTTTSYRTDFQEANLEWNRARAKVRVQQASLSALHKRIEIGRSLLSREKALLSLGGIGEV